MEAAEGSAAKPWYVKYDGVCVRCGLLMPKGSIGVYNPGSNTIQHVECPPAEVTEPEPSIDYGVAGASAQREYERRLANDDSRRNARFGRFAGLVHTWTGDRQSTTAWSSGAEGEIKVAKVLESLGAVRFLRDRAVPARKSVNIDLIAIAPAGIFVIDAKNHRGTVRIRDKGSFFKSDKRLYVGSRDQSKIAHEMGWQVEAVKSALIAAGVDPLPQVTPVLCFASADWPWLFAPAEYKGVRLEGLRSLKKLVVDKPTLDESGVERYTRILATALPPR